MIAPTEERGVGLPTATPGPWPAIKAMFDRIDDATIGLLIATGAEFDAINERHAVALDAASGLCMDLAAALRGAEAALDELLDYRGGADNALADPHVVERAQSALATARQAMAEAAPPASGREGGRS